MTASPALHNEPPPAPGALGVALPPRAILDYLSAALRWRDQLRTDLAALDRRAQHAQAAVALTADVTLAHAMVNAVGTKLDEIVAAWDSGRVGPVECERISQLVWGALGGGGGLGMAVSFVEGCVLASAMVDRLRDRVDADALAGGVGERLAALRAQLDRLRQMSEAGAVGIPVDQLADELAAAVARLGSGERIDAELARLDQAASLAERDAIIAGARARTLASDVAGLHERVAAAQAREAEARRDEALCAEKIAAPPRLAVPSVATLGPVPTDRAGVDAFAARLAQVERAVDEAARRFAAPLAARADLRGLLQSYQAMAGGRGHAEDLRLSAAYTKAHDVLWSAPCDIDLARTLVEEYQRLVREIAGAGQGRPASGPATGLEAF